MKGKILIPLMIFLALAVSVKAEAQITAGDLSDIRVYSKGDINLNVSYGIITDKSYGKVYTPYCSNDCNLPLSIEVKGKTKPSLICPSDIDFSKVILRGLDSTADLRLEYLTPYSYNLPQCLEGDYYHCSKWDNSTVVNSYQWLPLDKCVPASEVYGINIRGKLLGNSSIDIVPEMFRLSMPEYASWTWSENLVYNSGATSCGTAGGSGGNYKFGEKITTGSSAVRVMNFTKFSTTVSAHCYIYDSAYNIVYASDFVGDVCSFTNASVNATLNASSVYYIISNSTTRTSCSSGFSFPELTSNYSINASVYWDGANFHPLTSEWFAIQQIVVQANVSLPDPPRYSGVITDIATPYDSSSSVFNVTWVNGSASNVVNTSSAVLTLNGTNYSMALISGTNLSGVYGIEKILGVGFYNYSFSASSNDSQTNTTPVYNFTITQGLSNCSVTLDPVSPIVYGNEFKAVCVCDNPEGATKKLYRNGTDVTSQNNTNVLLGGGVYLYVCNSTATNYSTANDTDTMTVSQASPSWNYLINGVEANGTISPYSSNLTVGLNLPISECVECFTMFFKNSTSAYMTPTDMGFPENTSDWLNDTYWFGWNNSLPSDTYYVLMNWSGSENYSSGQDVVSFIVQESLIIEAFDENTLTPLTFNITLYNETNSLTAQNQTSFNNNSLTGNLTASISSTGYVSRDYFVEITPNSTFNLSTYLLPVSDGVYPSYWTYSNVNPMGEANVTLNVSRFIGSDWTVVEQDRSDYEGKGTLFLSPYAVYRITATKTGVGSILIDSYSANPNILIRLNLEGGVNASNVTWLFTNIDYSLEPTDIYIRNSSDNLTYINYTILSSDSQLDYYNLSLIWNDSSIYSTSGTTAEGGSLGVNFNMTGREGTNLIVKTTFKKSGEDPFSWNRTYIVVRSHSYIPEAIGGMASTLGLGEFVSNLIALFISLAGAGGVRKMSGEAGSSIVFLGILAFFVFVGFFNWLIFLNLAVISFIFIMGSKYV